MSGYIGKYFAGTASVVTVMMTFDFICHRWITYGQAIWCLDKKTRGRKIKYEHNIIDGTIILAENDDGTCERIY